MWNGDDRNSEMISQADFIGATIRPNKMDIVAQEVTVIDKDGYSATVAFEFYTKKGKPGLYATGYITRESIPEIGRGDRLAVLEDFVFIRACESQQSITFELVEDDLTSKEELLAAGYRMGERAPGYLKNIFRKQITYTVE